jgi:hypothetical protein
MKSLGNKLIFMGQPIFNCKKNGGGAKSYDVEKAWSFIKDSNSLQERICATYILQTGHLMRKRKRYRQAKSESIE